MLLERNCYCKNQAFFNFCLQLSFTSDVTTDSFLTDSGSAFKIPWNSTFYSKESKFGKLFVYLCYHILWPLEKLSEDRNITITFVKIEILHKVYFEIKNNTRMLFLSQYTGGFE